MLHVTTQSASHFSGIGFQKGGGANPQKGGNTKIFSRFGNYSSRQRATRHRKCGKKGGFWGWKPDDFGLQS
jgi:hypothetical protein